MDHSPLSKLPPELRTRIHEVTLHDDKPIILKWYYGAPSLRAPAIPATATPSRTHLLALPSLCKQLRQEALLLFYATNTVEFEFEFDAWGYHGAALVKQFIDRIGPVCFAALGGAIVNIGCKSEARYLDLVRTVDNVRDCVACAKEGARR
ncbi:hypothetical protein LTR85_009288 [Meristemomyces frigidus]|nr:hypothetical protein LTR85_009288 [Meristemomyces frigidus]